MSSTRGWFVMSHVLSFFFIVNPSKDCSVNLDSDVCGEDHKTYKSECALSTQGISLAYYGPCKGECFVDDRRVSCSFF